MNAQQALADLTEISSQIQAAVVFDEKGKVAGSTLADSGRAGQLALAATELLAAADEVRTGDSPVTQLEIATGEGSVFVVRDGKNCIAATTAGDPTVGLVFYDLKSTLRSLKAPVKAPPKKRAAKKTTAAAPKKKTAARKPAARKKPDAS